MSLAQITEKIERDARDEAEKILGTARERENDIKKDAEREVRSLEDSAQARFDKERPEIFKRREIVARLDVDKLHLGVRRKLIQDVFDAALERLANLDRNEYLGFCERLLSEAASEGDGVLEVSSKEKYIDQEWLNSFNARNGRKILLSNNRQDFLGGFVLSRGRICVNCSWEMLMRSAQERLEPEVVKRLFPA
jgi:V/A-type H+-transporting ATPase subunit E